MAEKMEDCSMAGKWAEWAMLDICILTPTYNFVGTW